MQRGPNLWPGFEMLWNRRLCEDPIGSLTPLPISHACETMGEEPGFISGEVFTDGSLIHHRYPALRRAGWAFAVLDEAGHEKYACFGPLPLEQGRQSIFLVELWAIVMALQVAIAPIHTDCANILKGVERGAEWCTRPESHWANLWHCFWHFVSRSRVAFRHSA